MQSEEEVKAVIREAMHAAPRSGGQAINFDNDDTLDDFIEGQQGDEPPLMGEEW